MKKLFFIIVFLFYLNANAQWIQHTLPYNGFAYTLAFFNANNGISFGHTDIDFTENIFYTTNSGLNWIQAGCPPGIRAIVDAQYVNSLLVYACGAENFHFGINKGMSNDFISCPDYIRQKMLSEGKREFFNLYKSAFLKSTDSGLSWMKVGAFDTLTGYVNSIHFLNANTGYALIDTNPSQRTKFFKTTNGGANWQIVHYFDPELEVENLVFLNANTGFAIGNILFPMKNRKSPQFNDDVGRIFKTIDGGLNWTTLSFAPQISSLTFMNQTTGIAMGNSNGFENYIFKTTNAGSNWFNTLTFSSRRMLKVKSLPNTGTAFASGFLIDTINLVITKFTTAKTTDFGANWIINDLNPAAYLPGLALVNENIFFTSGRAEGNYHAIIFKSTNGGNVFVSQTGTELPSSFKLYQNYPNPFNPSTRINFDISKPGFVKISVYNLLGREVSVSVNEYLNTGSYTTGWDASAHPSGVYFYKLESGNYSETKKMLLLK